MPENMPLDPKKIQTVGEQLARVTDMLVEVAKSMSDEEWVRTKDQYLQNTSMLAKAVGKAADVIRRQADHIERLEGKSGGATPPTEKGGGRFGH